MTFEIFFTIEHGINEKTESFKFFYASNNKLASIIEKDD